jgi:hypothetical protein
MSVMRAHERGMQHPREPDIVDERATAAQEARILAPKHTRAD